MCFLLVCNVCIDHACFLHYFIIEVSFLNIVYIQHKCHKIIVEIEEPHLTTAAATHVRACLLSRL